MSNLEGKIEYKDVDGILSNGFSGMFYFSKDDNVVASGKITRVPGNELSIDQFDYLRYQNIFEN